MNNGRMVEFRIGLMVLASIVALIILVLLFGPKEGLFRLQRRYRLQVRFDAAPGVMVDTPVRKSGIPIGRVGRIELLDDGPGVLVSIDIDEGRQIFTNEGCRINRTLLGDSELEFVRLPDYRGEIRPVQQDGPPLAGLLSPDPLQVVGNLEGALAEAITEVAATSRKLGEFVDRINYVVGTPEDIDEKVERFNRIIERTDATMHSIDQLAGSINNIVGDPELQSNLRSVLQEMPAVMQDSRQLVTRLDRSLNLVDSNLENMDEVTGLLARNAGPMFQQLSTTVDQLNMLAANLTTFSESLNRGEGTIGRLVHDPELYDRLNRTVRNVELLTVELRPVVNDARILSDKLARDPGLLGVRGALRPDPGLKVPPSLLTRPAGASMMMYNPPSPAGSPYPVGISDIPCEDCLRPTASSAQASPPRGY